LAPVVTDMFESMENSADAQTGFIRFKPEYTTAIRLLADTHISLGQMDAAADVLDAVKTVNQASLRNSNLVRSSLFTEAERLADFTVSQEIETIRAQLMDAEEAERLELNNRLLQLQQQRISGIKPLERTLKDTQSRLREGEMIVSVTVLDSVVYRTVMSRNRISVSELPGRKAMIDSWTDLGSRLRVGQTPLRRLHTLYTTLLGDVMTSDVTKLVFVPDGPMHRIPVDILPTTAPTGDAAYGSVRYLVERVPITYATSIREHSMVSKTRRRYPSDFLGVGISRLDAFPKLNPLPYAEEEVGRIRASLGSLSNRSTLIGRQATEQAIREQASDNRILHIASHSEVNLTDPLFSVIYLEADETEDGALYAYELFGLDLDAELIMLSSCESGGGAIIQGSGMVGLGRAFRSAGARSLIMNVWSIEDRTASDISTWFYENLNAGMSKDEALRQAKIRYITTRNSNPYVWGSFILIGEDDALIKKISTREWLVGGFLVLILGGALMLFYRRRR
jgi:CHAT domain-containing protein